MGVNKRDPTRYGLCKTRITLTNFKPKRWPTGNKDCATAVATAPYAVVEHSVSHVWCTGTLRIWISLGSCAASWAASCPASPRSSSGRRPGRSSTLRVVPWEMLEHRSAAHPVWTARLRWRYRSNSQRLSSEMESQNTFTFVIFQYARFRGKYFAKK